LPFQELSPCEEVELYHFTLKVSQPTDQNTLQTQAVPSKMHRLGSLYVLDCGCSRNQMTFKVSSNRNHSISLWFLYILGSISTSTPATN